MKKINTIYEKNHLSDFKDDAKDDAKDIINRLTKSFNSRL